MDFSPNHQLISCHMHQFQTTAADTHRSEGNTHPYFFLTVFPDTPMAFNQNPMLSQ